MSAKRQSHLNAMRMGVSSKPFWKFPICINIPLPMTNQQLLEVEHDSLLMVIVIDL